MTTLRNLWNGPPGRRRLVLGLVLVLVAGAAVVGARQATVALRGDQSVTVADPGGNPGGGGQSEAEEPGSVGAADPVPADLTPGARVVLTPVFGEPTITPYDRDPVPDTLHIEPGPVVGLAASLPTVDPPAAGGDYGDGGSAGGGDDPFEPPFEIPDLPVEAAPPPQPFGVGIWVEPVGHYARVTVGVNGGPDGLAALRVDFGDGSTHTLSAGRVDQLRDGGTLTLVHRYVPTLTPQPRQAAATATDGAGRTRQASTRFDTQAEFKASFSAMTITALDDCDFIGGKGDFLLAWNIDGRDKESRFDLDQGESYVEQGFRIGLDGIRYGEGFVYHWTIAELDPGFERFVKVWDWEFRGPKGFIATDVMELGTHTYPVTGEFTTFGDPDCDVGYAYAYTLTMPDQPPHAR